MGRLSQNNSVAGETPKCNLSNFQANHEKRINSFNNHSEATAFTCATLQSQKDNLRAFVH